MEKIILEDKDKIDLNIFLKKIDKDFPIHLSDRVDIYQYIDKILKNGYGIIYKDNKKIVATILFYANDIKSKEAYISLIGVDKKYRRMHLANNLLDEALKIIVENGCRKVKLYTHKTNDGAKKMYVNKGFELVDSDREHSVCFIKKLNAPRVLITAIGSFSTDIAIKEIHKLNFEIVGCDIYNKEWVVDASNVDYFEKAPLAIKEEEYIEFIKQLCKKYTIKYIIPTTDIEVDVLCKYKEQFKNEGVYICISNCNVIKLCRSKIQLPNRLKHICPDNLIKTQLLSEVEEKNIKFPIIIKPINGRSSQGIQRIYNEKQFNYYTNICENKKDMIVQPIIEGTVVTVDVVADLKNDIAIAVPRREFLRTGNGAGTTVQVFHDDELIKLSIKIAKELKINGAINMEFIESADKQYYFLEINPRFSGGVEFTNIAGYNIITNHLRCFMDKKIEEKCEYKDLIIARKYEEYVTQYFNS